MTNPNLSDPAITALLKMRKGFYLLQQNGYEGYCDGANYEWMKAKIENGTIAELLERKYIRSSGSVQNVFMLTDAGREFCNQFKNTQ